MGRQLPNILVTGTPGTGKSTTAKRLQESAPSLTYVDVSSLVKEKQLHDGWDEAFETYILDEDRVRSLIVITVQLTSRCGLTWAGVR